MEQTLDMLLRKLTKAAEIIGLKKPGFQGGVRVGLRIEARDADGNLTDVIERDALATQQFMQLVQLGMLATGESIKDTAGTSHSETTAATTGSAVTLAAGTTGTTAAVTDNALGTETETTTSVTVNAYSGSGTSGSFTVTGTITATANRAYQEVGMKITVNGHVYLIAHDTFSTLNVSNGGTLSITYTFTGS